MRKSPRFDPDELDSHHSTPSAETLRNSNENSDVLDDGSLKFASQTRQFVVSSAAAIGNSRCRPAAQVGVLLAAVEESSSSAVLMCYKMQSGKQIIK